MAAKGRAFSQQVSNPSFPANDYFYRMILFLPAVFVAATFLLGLPALYHRLTYPLQVEQGEAINVEKGLILLRGENLYPDSAKGGPYLYSVYPPLFSWLEAGLLKATGLVWQPGRFLAFAGYLGCGILLGAWGFRRWGWVWAVFSALLLWIFPTWAEWGTMVRCDALALFFHFAAFLLLYGDSLKPAKGRMGIAAAGLFNAAAVLIKQSTLALAVVYGLYCVARRQWARLGDYALFFLAPLTVVFAIEQVQTKGLFYEHTVAWANTGFDMRAFWYLISRVFWREGGALSAAVLLLWAVKRVPLLPKIQIVFSGLSLLSLGRVLGAENYWLEFLLYGIFFIGEAWVSPWNGIFRWSPGGKTAVWGRVLLGVALYVFLPAGKWPTTPPAEERDAKLAASKIYETGENHLALDLDLPVMAGKKIWIQPAEYTAMVKRGIWSEEPLIGDIRSKKFSTIELYDRPEQYLLPKPVVEEIQNNYHVKIRELGRLWFVPNG